ncbi:MAG: SAM-dependent methyltransferase [Chthoniobacteraceae bacterium]
MTPESELLERLCETIRTRGPITFREFMERALYEPDFGYYATAHRAIGRQGDFFTNVSVGPLFGGLLARQIVEIWERLDRPKPFHLVEQGAHHGQLMADIVRSLRGFAPALAESVECVMVEPQPHLRAVQKTTLAELTKPTWVNSPRDLPLFTGLHFSNELVDAFPVHRVVCRDNEWLEQHVGCRNDHLVFEDGAISSSELVAAVNRLGPRPNGYETEINLAAAPWIRAVAAQMVRGAVLVIDYGFAHETNYELARHRGTLQARGSHRLVENPLSNPGQIDLTAHVDFTHLAEAGLEAGLDLAGFTDQHHFLVGLSRAHFREGAIPDGQEARAFQTLMHPTLLGRAFMVLAMTRGLNLTSPLLGFAFGGDARRHLGLGTPACGAETRRSPNSGPDAEDRGVTSAR